MDWQKALAAGDWAGARRAAAQIMASDPARAHFVLGVAASAQGDFREALAQLAAAVAAQPDPAECGEYRAQLARILCLMRRDGEAAEQLRLAEMALPADGLSRDTLGCVYARLGQHHAALPHFQAAVAAAPDNADFAYNRAVTLNFLGQVGQAQAALEGLLARHPHEARAHHLLANLRKWSASENHVVRLEQAYAAASDPRDQLLLGYALAKELEDLGQEQAGFGWLARVNARHRARLDYDVARDLAVFEAMAEGLAALRPAEQPPEGGEAPIFVIGMPRTGTTLVDRILSSHPQVESLGELQAMPLAAKALARTSGRLVLDVPTALAAAQGDMSSLGRDYLARAAHHRKSDRPRFIDKFPGNFLYAGFIAHALPQARIVCLRRHPMDTVLSNFRNLFAISSRYYDYSYDLDDIAQYYLGFDRLMGLWAKAMPGRVLEISYEALVADQEGQTRALLAHCGLDWDERCLAFQDNAAPVATPSAAQVRRPLYNDALARWRRHEVALGGVKARFAAAGLVLD